MSNLSSRFPLTYHSLVCLLFHPNIYISFPLLSLSLSSHSSLLRTASVSCPRLVSHIIEQPITLHITHLFVCFFTLIYHTHCYHHHDLASPSPSPPPSNLIHSPYSPLTTPLTLTTLTPTLTTPGYLRERGGHRLRHIILLIYLCSHPHHHHLTSSTPPIFPPLSQGIYVKGGATVYGTSFFQVAPTWSDLRLKKDIVRLQQVGVG